MPNQRTTTRSKVALGPADYSEGFASIGGDISHTLLEQTGELDIWKESLVTMFA
jgi:hypothetical protein